MAKRKQGQQRSQRERDAHRRIIADAVLKCRYIPDVAKELEVDVTTAYADIKALQKQWVQDAMESISEVRARELKKLQVIEDEAWAAWRRSIGTTVMTREGATAQGMIDLTEKREINGDPRYLSIIRDCMEQRAKLLGMDKMPEDWEPSKSDIHVNITDGTIEERIARVRDRRLEVRQLLSKKEGKK